MSIFSNFFKDKSFNKLIDKYDLSISSIPAPSSSADSDSLISHVIRQATTDKSDNDPPDVDSIFSSLSVSQERLSRYSTYNELFSAVQIIKRIVILYLNNVLLRDPITNKILLIKSTEEASDSGKNIEYERFVKTFIDYFDIEEKIKNLTASDVLKYGDGFIEVIDIDNLKLEYPKFKKTPKTKNSLVTESELLNALKKTNGYFHKNNDELVTELLMRYVEFSHSPISENILSENLIKEDKQSAIFSPYSLSKVMLKFHKPHAIIPLITEFDTILGYVEISSRAYSNASGGSSNNLVNLTTIINQISSNSYIGGDSKAEKQEGALELFSHIIFTKILNNYKILDTSKVKDNEAYENLLKTKLKPEIHQALKRILLSAKPNSLFKEKLNIRFIESNNIFHFKNSGSGSQYPYGDSIIDPLIFPGKLYLLTQLANAVTRLSRSSIMRKWTIETGHKEDINSLLQKFKANLKNKRITGDDIATSKNLPKILSDYKDMVTYKKKGVNYVDLDILNSGDPNVNVRDLEDLRKELISLSGVPSSYLGYQDMSDLRDSLTNVNIVFANDISAIQKSFNDKLTDLVSRVAEIVGFKKSDTELKKHVFISCIPPTVLILQNIEASINSISTIQRVFAEIPEIDVDPMYLLRRYAPMIDWVEFEKEAQDFKQRKKVSTTTGDSNAMGMNY